MFKDGKYLVVSKSDYPSNLGLLTASLKSSKKNYITFLDPSIVHRAVIKTVLVPVVELEHLDKAVKPSYWNILQDMKGKHIQDVSVADFKDAGKFGTVHSFGLSDEDDLIPLLKWHNLKDNDVKAVISPNKYCIVTKKF